MTETTKKWNEETTAKLLSVVGSESPVSAGKVKEAAAALEVSERSVAAKLRQLDMEVDSLAKTKAPTFTKEESDVLADFVNTNAGMLTYQEISEQVLGGKFSAKQVQGKLLAMELTDRVKPTERAEVARTYTEQEEATFVNMAQAGAFIEDIATALNKSIESVRGKALSLTRAGALNEIPKQRQSHAKDQVDPVTALGDAIIKMTVAQIATAVDKTERGIKTLLTRRGITVADYDGAGKKAKSEAKAAEVATAKA